MPAHCCTGTSREVGAGKKIGTTDHANPEGNGPQHFKERGRRGSTGPPLPEQRRQKHPRNGGLNVQVHGDSKPWIRLTHIGRKNVENQDKDAFNHMWLYIVTGRSGSKPTSFNMGPVPNGAPPCPPVIGIYSSNCSV